MKSITALAAAAAAAAFAFAGSASAVTVPLGSQPIMAGQNTVAGTVEVTKDATNVYVNFTLDGWCMTTSQVAVAWDGMSLPTTKKGNPQPGQFPFKSYYGDCVQTATTTVPISQIADNPTVLNPGGLFLAVHVDLFEATETTISAMSTPGETVYGPLEAYAGPTSSLWTPLAKTAVTPDFASAGVWPSLSLFPGLETASWITTNATTELPSGGGTITDDSWRMADFTLTVPAGSFVSAGEVIAVTSDNAEEAYLNGTLIGHDGIMQGPGQDSLEWQTISPGYSFTPVAGANHFQIIWRNYGTQMGLNLPVGSNPNGLVYGVSINYHTPTNHGETGWAGVEGQGAFGFDGANWATYFNVPVS